MSQQILEVQMSQTEQATKAAQTAMTSLNEKFAKASAGFSDPSQMIDISNADLESVHAHTKTMEGNIAELIMGLDDVTRSFSGQFDAMRTQTGAEKFIGFFVKGKAEAMRAERIRAASIDENLGDLISKSKSIKGILSENLNVIREAKANVETNLTATFAQREATIVKLEDTRAQIFALDPILADLEMRLSSSTDNITRTQLETELANRSKEHNELVKQEQVLLTESQTLERYIESGKTWVDSLQNQEATQIVLISKLDIDTQQRVVLYDALTKSLKTAQQQDVAHRINEIGVKTDQNAQAAMAAIGAATNARMADMMEAHEGHMVFSQKVLQQKQQADERFARRFAEIAAKHDSALYQG